MNHINIALLFALTELLTLDGYILSSEEAAAYSIELKKLLYLTNDIEDMLYKIVCEKSSAALEDAITYFEENNKSCI